MKKSYQKPEVKIVELSFNATQLGFCNTHTITFPLTGPLSCQITGCQDQPDGFSFFNERKPDRDWGDIRFPRSR